MSDKANEDNVKVESGKKGESAKTPATEKQTSNADAGKVAALAAELEATKAKLAKEASARKEIAAKYDGLDPNTAKEAIDAMEQAKKTALERQGEYTEALKMQEESFAKLIAKKDKLIAEKDNMVSELNNKMKRVSIERSFANSQFIADNVALSPQRLQKLWGENFEVTEDGDIRAYNEPVTSPTRLPILNDSGKPASFDEAVEKIISSQPDASVFLKSKVRKGADSSSEPSSLKKNQKEEANNEITSGAERIQAAMANMFAKTA